MVQMHKSVAPALREFLEDIVGEVECRSVGVNKLKQTLAQLGGLEYLRFQFIDDQARCLADIEMEVPHDSVRGMSTYHESIVVEVYMPDAENPAKPIVLQGLRYATKEGFESTRYDSHGNIPLYDSDLPFEDAA